MITPKSTSNKGKNIFILKLYVMLYENLWTPYMSIILKFISKILYPTSFMLLTIILLFVW